MMRRSCFFPYINPFRSVKMRSMERMNWLNRKELAWCESSDLHANMKRLFIVSSYPAKNQLHGTNTVGVASYTKNTLKALTGFHKDLRITVWAETLEKEEVYKI